MNEWMGRELDPRLASMQLQWVRTPERRVCKKAKIIALLETRRVGEYEQKLGAVRAAVCFYLWPHFSNPQRMAAIKAARSWPTHADGLGASALLAYRLFRWVCP